jgi:hypothetical protein
MKLMEKNAFQKENLDGKMQSCMQMKVIKELVCLKLRHLGK